MTNQEKSEAFKDGLRKVADGLEGEGNMSAAELIRATLPEFNTVCDRDIARLYDFIKAY